MLTDHRRIQILFINNAEETATGADDADTVAGTVQRQKPAGTARRRWRAGARWRRRWARGRVVDGAESGRTVGGAGTIGDGGAGSGRCGVRRRCGGRFSA
jgi:hypothetical protein